MNCSPESLSALHDGALSAVEASRVAAHRDSCVGCLAEWEALASLEASLVEGDPAGPLSAALLESLVVQARQAVTRRRPATPLTTISWFWSRRISVPVPALVFGLAVALMLATRGTVEPVPVGGSQWVERAGPRRDPLQNAVFQQWDDPSQLWMEVQPAVHEAPPVPAPRARRGSRKGTRQPRSEQFVYEETMNI